MWKQVIEHIERVRLFHAELKQTKFSKRLYYSVFGIPLSFRSKFNKLKITFFHIFCLIGLAIRPTKKLCHYVVDHKFSFKIVILCYLSSTVQNFEHFYSFMCHLVHTIHILISSSWKAISDWTVLCVSVSTDRRDLHFKAGSKGQFWKV